jgi:deazaflavin-dependent oxidoreductase (nitroreductase family)
MTTQPTILNAGQPRFSRPIRRLAGPIAPIARLIAGRRWFPFYAILRHTGRSSGTAYATPVVALRTPDGFMIPLPFGDATQWAKNLAANNGGGLRFAGREYRIAEPRIVDREVAAAYLPAALRIVAGRLGIRNYVLVRRTSN